MEQINMVDKFIDLVIALVQAGIIAVIANGFVKRTFNAINNNRALNDCGMYELNMNNKLYKRQMRKVFKHASHIKMCYITGGNLLSDYYDEIKFALNRKDKPLNKLEILLCRPNTNFMNNIENIEKFYGYRDDKDETLISSSNKIIKMYNELGSDKVEIRYNDSFYFFPYMIAEYKKKDGILKEVYANFNITPRQAKKAIAFVAQAFIKNEIECYNYDTARSEWILDDEDKNIVMDIENNFNYIWARSTKATCEISE